MFLMRAEIYRSPKMYKGNRKVELRHIPKNQNKSHESLFKNGKSRPFCKAVTLAVCLTKRQLL